MNDQGTATATTAEPAADRASAGRAGSDPGLDRPAELFRALGDPTRLAIYEIIRQGGPSEQGAADLRRSVSAIASQVDVSLSTVSHHIKELRRAGLIRCERRGQTIFCSAAPEAVEAIRRYLDR